LLRALPGACTGNCSGIRA